MAFEWAKRGKITTSRAGANKLPGLHEKSGEILRALQLKNICGFHVLKVMRR